jgi:sec-independent protein translocase protein TatC
MPLADHLRELRSRLVKSGIAIVIGMVAGWILYPTTFALLSEPFEGAVAQAQAEGRDVTLALTGVTDPFVLQLQVAAITGIVIAAPIWLYQLWRFVTPGLHKHEKRWGIAFVAVATPLFFAGTLLAYTVLPVGLEILLGFHARQRREHRLGRSISVLLHPHGDRVRRGLPHAVADRHAELRRGTHR